MDWSLVILCVLVLDIALHVAAIIRSSQLLQRIRYVVKPTCNEDEFPEEAADEAKQCRRYKPTVASVRANKLRRKEHNGAKQGGP